MLHIYMPGLGKPSQPDRYGDGQIVTDGTNYLIIDAFCGVGTDLFIKKIKQWKIKSPILAISHAHYDHEYGILKIIRDSYFTPKILYCYDPASLQSGLSNNKGSQEVRSDIKYLRTIINEAKDKGITVKYLKNNQTVTHGDIKFKVYRKQPSKVQNDDTEGWNYINDGSLCFYFYEIGYWTSGDGPERIYDLANSVGAKVKFFKIPHHGNNCTNSQAAGFKKQGANFCWYNHLEPKGVGTTDFTAYGARRCKQNGITVLDQFTDINLIAYNGKAVIYHNSKEMTNYACSYKGKSTLKSAPVDVIRNIFMNRYGTGDTRMTNLIRAGYYPVNANNKVAKVKQLANNIIDGKVNYGKNEARINKIDELLGSGYGLLVQDEINSLLNTKNKKW